MTLVAIIVVGVACCLYREGKADVAHENKNKSKRDYMLLGYLFGTHERD